MAYEFTKLSEVPVADTVSDECSVLVEDCGDIKRTAKSNIGKEQVQADWNQTDPTQPDYIKNKLSGASNYQYLVTDGDGNTKWEDRLAYESITEKKLIDNASVTVNRDSGASENVSCDWELIVGEKYTVRDDDYVVEGIVAQEGNGYKFLVVEDGGASLYQYPGYWKFMSRANGQHTLTLSGPSASIKKIDPKYIPSELNEIILLSSTSGSSKQFKITVDDSGTISATEVS